jgi:hypothetical protein
MKVFRAYLKAVLKIIKHKWYVGVAGRKVGLSWKRILLHDLSKFTPTELKYYTHKFELGDCGSYVEKIGWKHHVMQNTHHIEHWEWYSREYCSMSDKYKQVWMPDEDIREMIADWVGASVAYSGKWPVAGEWEWGNKFLVDKVKKLQNGLPTEGYPRGMAVLLLDKMNMITKEQYKEVWALE